MGGRFGGVIPKYPVREELLAYLWKTQKFRRSSLKTSDGRTLVVVKPGQENSGAGPDFFHAHIHIDDTLWVGNVELHLRASDWFAHKHEQDTNYDNVILHVVWENDMPVYDAGQQPMPTLLLSEYAPKNLITKYKNWLNQKKNWILCEDDFHKVPKIVLHQFWERLYTERLMEKTALYKGWLAANSNNWEAVFFVALAKGFGLKHNGMAFAQMALSIPWKSVLQCTKIAEMEALFFGQIRILCQETTHAYHQELSDMYSFLSHKYKLNPIEEPVQFFRLRPPNFPTIRLAQLSWLLHKEPRLFTKILAANTLDQWYALLDAKTSPFWETHYNFNTPSKKRVHQLTKSFKQLLLLNTIFPFLFHYYAYIGSAKKEQVLDWVRQLSPEKNNITNKFKQLGCVISDALESQASLQLKTAYCAPRRCLNCAVGHQLLNL